MFCQSLVDILHPPMTRRSRPLPIENRDPSSPTPRFGLRKVCASRCPGVSVSWRGGKPTLPIPSIHPRHELRMLIRCPAPAWLCFGCGPRRLCSGARLRAHISPTRQDIIARVLGAHRPLMAHFAHLIELLRAVADIILGGCALCLDGPSTRSRRTHVTPPASPYP